ncbi:hypothetical protein C8J57DRAFT_1460047 [Mycena rebaudengoi]|nr:hypothetical protein C8J57DRAFT_1460047 [Mycena rebaudengoi]
MFLTGDTASGKTVVMPRSLEENFRGVAFWNVAPGFQTNVRKIRVPPELMARIRRGEDVSPDEISVASARMDAEERDGPITPQDTPSESKKKETKLPEKEPPSEPVNEWLPHHWPQETLQGQEK